MHTLIDWHKEIEILKICEKKAMLFFEGEFFDTEAGDIVLITPFRMHAFFGEAKIQSRLIALESFDRLLEFLPILNAKQAAPCILKNYSIDTLQIFDDNIFASKTEELLRGLLLTLQSKNLVKASRPSIFDRQLHAVRIILEFLKNNYQNEIRVHELAKMVCFSEFYFKKVFKKITGFGILDYINFFRLHTALAQLKQSNVEVAKVARSVGFVNISYFNRQFKKLFFCTPSEILRKTSC